MPYTFRISFSIKLKLILISHALSLCIILITHILLIFFWGAIKGNLRQQQIHWPCNYMAYSILSKTGNYFLQKVTCSLSFVLLVKLWHTSYFLWSRSVCLSNQLWWSLGGGVRLPISIVGRSVADGLDIHSVIASLTHSQRISSLSDRWEMDHSLWLLFVFLYKEVFWTKGIWVSGLVSLPVT